MARQMSAEGVQEPPARLPTLMRRPASSSQRPLVSICIPTFNHGQYVEGAVRSALAQTYEPIEVVISDDRSEDGSSERLRKIDDPRIRLHQNPRRLGHAPNRNHVLGLARGELLKFLDDDDLLEPSCISRMVELFAQDPAVGMVFSKRHALLEGDNTEQLNGWLMQYGVLHDRFDRLETINDGRELLRQWLHEGLKRNWIGEPSAVMVSRTHLAKAGGFSLHVRQLMDVDLWVRILPHALIGFVNEELASYRFGHVAASKVNNANRRAWLDRLWMFDGLATDLELTDAYPEIPKLLHAERRQAWRTFVKLGRGAAGARVPATMYVPYGIRRLKARLGIHEPAVPAVVVGDP